LKFSEDGLPCCDVCHVPASMAEVTVTLTKQVRETEAVCKLCAGLLEAGLIRLDHSEPDGTPRYRRWNFEWTPGDLVPIPREV
jgi:hypothetical protein